MIRNLGKLPTSEQLLRQKLPGLKPGLDGERGILPEKGGAFVAMPVFKYFAVVGLALLVLLFVSDALFGESESKSRFDGSLYESALYAPRSDETTDTMARRFPHDVTAAVRVREVFAQFVPNENKRGKRYASTAAFIR